MLNCEGEVQYIYSDDASSASNDHFAASPEYLTNAMHSVSPWEVNSHTVGTSTAAVPNANTPNGHGLSNARINPLPVSDTVPPSDSVPSPRNKYFVDPLTSFSCAPTPRAMGRHRMHLREAQRQGAPHHNALPQEVGVHHRHTNYQHSQSPHRVHADPGMPNSTSDSAECSAPSGQRDRAEHSPTTSVTHKSESSPYHSAYPVRTGSHMDTPLKQQQPPPSADSQDPLSRRLSGRHGMISEAAHSVSPLTNSSKCPRKTRASSAEDSNCVTEYRRLMRQYTDLVFAQLRRIMLAERRRELQKATLSSSPPIFSHSAYRIDEPVPTSEDVQGLVDELEQLERALGQHATTLIQSYNRAAIQYMNEKQFSHALQALLHADAVAKKGAGLNFRYLPEPEELDADAASRSAPQLPHPTWEMAVPYFAPLLETNRRKACAAMENNLGLYHFKLGEYGLALQRMLRAVELERSLQIDTIGISYFNLSQAQWELRAYKRALTTIELAAEAVERRIFQTKDKLSARNHEACCLLPGSSSSETEDGGMPFRAGSSSHHRPSPAPRAGGNLHGSDERTAREQEHRVSLWLQWREDVSVLARIKEQNGCWLQDLGYYKKAMLVYDQGMSWMGMIPRLDKTEIKYLAKLKDRCYNCRKLQRKRESEEAVLHRPVPLGHGLFERRSSSSAPVRSAVVTTVLPRHVEVSEENLCTTEDSGNGTISNSSRHRRVSPVVLSRFSLLQGHRGRQSLYAPCRSGGGSIPSRRTVSCAAAHASFGGPSRSYTPRPEKRQCRKRPALSQAKTAVAAPHRRPERNADTELTPRVPRSIPDHTPRTSSSTSTDDDPRVARRNNSRYRRATPSTQGRRSPQRRYRTSAAPASRTMPSAACGRVRPSQMSYLRKAYGGAKTPQQQRGTSANQRRADLNDTETPRLEPAVLRESHIRAATSEPRSLAWCLDILHAFARSKYSQVHAKERGTKATTSVRSGTDAPSSNPTLATAPGLVQSETRETIIYSSLDEQHVTYSSEDVAPHTPSLSENGVGGSVERTRTPRVSTPLDEDAQLMFFEVDDTTPCDQVVDVEVVAPAPLPPLDDSSSKALSHADTTEKDATTPPSSQTLWTESTPPPRADPPREPSSPPPPQPTGQAIQAIVAEAIENELRELKHMLQMALRGSLPATEATMPMMCSSEECSTTAGQLAEASAVNAATTAEHPVVGSVEEEVAVSVASSPHHSIVEVTVSAPGAVLGGGDATPILDTPFMQTAAAECTVPAAPPTACTPSVSDVFLEDVAPNSAERVEWYEAVTTSMLLCDPSPDTSVEDKMLSVVSAASSEGLPPVHVSAPCATQQRLQALLPQDDLEMQQMDDTPDDTAAPHRGSSAADEPLAAAAEAHSTSADAPSMEIKGERSNEVSSHSIKAIDDLPPQVVSQPKHQAQATPTRELYMLDASVGCDTTSTKDAAVGTPPKVPSTEADEETLPVSTALTHLSTTSSNRHRSKVFVFVSSSAGEERRPTLTPLLATEGARLQDDRRLTSSNPMDSDPLTSQADRWTSSPVNTMPDTLSSAPENGKPSLPARGGGDRSSFFSSPHTNEGAIVARWPPLEAADPPVGTTPLVTGSCKSWLTTVDGVLTRLPYKNTDCTLPMDAAAPTTIVCDERTYVTAPAVTLSRDQREGKNGFPRDATLPVCTSSDGTHSTTLRQETSVQTFDGCRHTASNLGMRSYTAAFTEDLSNLQNGTPNELRRRSRPHGDSHIAPKEVVGSPPPEDQVHERLTSSQGDTPWSKAEQDSARRAQIRQSVLQRESATLIQQEWRRQRGSILREGDKPL